MFLVPVGNPVDCLCCQDIADVEEQKFEGKKQFTFMFPFHKFHKFPFMQVFYQYYHFLSTALYFRCFFL